MISFISATELPQAPAIRAQGIALDPDDVRGVIVSWNAGYDGNSPIISYSVQYQELPYGSGEHIG